MTKDVIVSIAGLQFEVDQDEALEVISPGEYYYRNGKHYIIYDEIDLNQEGEKGISKSTIKISPDQIEIMKKGLSNVHMVFELGKKNMTYYHTPVGNLMIGLDTTKLDVVEKENEIGINMEYGLDVNYNYISECSIKIKVSGKNAIV